MMHSLENRNLMLNARGTPTPTPPSSYPWVDYELAVTNGIDSTPVMVLGLEQLAMIDSIRITNTCGSPLLADVYLLREIEGVAKVSFVAYRFSLQTASALELLEGSVLYPKAGDTFWANSDFSGNTYDSLISYRQLLESEKG
jgi:hypothetical protein